MPETIFTLTVVAGKDRSHNGTRCWAWFPDLDSAIASVHDDTEFYLECGYYDYFVIEEVPSRSISPGRKETWFSAEFVEKLDADGNLVDHYYDIKILDKKPDEFRHFCNWSLG